MDGETSGSTCVIDVDGGTGEEGVMSGRSSINRIVDIVNGEMSGSDRSKYVDGGNSGRAIAENVDGGTSGGTCQMVMMKMC